MLGNHSFACFFFPWDDNDLQVPYLLKCIENFLWMERCGVYHLRNFVPVAVAVSSRHVNARLHKWRRKITIRIFPSTWQKFAVGKGETSYIVLGKAQNYLESMRQWSTDLRLTKTTNKQQRTRTKTGKWIRTNQHQNPFNRSADSTQNDVSLFVASAEKVWKQNGHFYGSSCDMESDFPSLRTALKSVSKVQKWTPTSWDWTTYFVVSNGARFNRNQHQSKKEVLRKFATGRANQNSFSQ